jgi:hypothetical protein
MHGFLQKSIELRLGVIDYITDYLKKVNRNLVIPHGALTYLCWDYAQEPTEEDMVSLVPEMELTLVGLNQKGELFFIDASGEEVHQGNLDTEELIYVADFIDELKLQAPSSEDSE